MLAAFQMLFCAPGHAEEELAPGFDMCAEKAESTADQIECATNAYLYWDKILNANYKKAKSGCEDFEHPKQCVSELLKAQRSWIKYKEEMINVIFMINGGGSLARLQADVFAATETKKQAQLLSAE